MSQISSFHIALLDGANEQRPSAPASSSFHLRVPREQIDIYTIGLSDVLARHLLKFKVVHISFGLILLNSHVPESGDGCRERQILH